MLEAEINPAGDVLVEGHHVGELQGFRFTADQKAEGEDAKAVRAAAQKILAGEFEARAERFAACGNSDFALTADGLVRWLGAPVAVLIAGDDALRPRAILLADEQLTGAARDKVAARIDRFVNFQIETALKPLFELQAAEQLSGMARGIAFQLVENFGLLNRRDVAEDVRGLDQDARAALRRLGVRFGAFHVFVPALLKPGPAGIVTLLWALKNDGKDRPGFGDVVNALASGRTSLVVDQAIDREFYRLAGYRNLGRRAVRVDILERLADLIRPALAWKAGAETRPEGAFGGSAFLVTPTMMSILGATAEDMDEILKGLGYRGDVKPEAEVKAKLDAFDAEAKTKADADKPADETPAGPTGEELSEAPADASAPQAVEPVAGSGDEAETVEVETTVPAPAMSSEASVESGAAVAPAEPEEPKTITIWRQGRFEGRARREHGNRNARGNQRHQGGRGGENGADGEKRGFRGKKAGDERRDGKGPQRKGGKPHGRQEGKPGGERRWEAKAPREAKPAKLDPDSPFAKLAALKEQLKK